MAEKVTIPPVVAARVLEAQAVLAEVTLQLIRIEDRLTRVAASLPVPPNQEDMLEDRIPRDLATDLLGLIECLVADRIRPAIEDLEKGASIRLPHRTP